MPEIIAEELKTEIVELVGAQRKFAEDGISDLDERVKKVDETLGEKFQLIEDITAKNVDLEKAMEESNERMKELEGEVALRNLSGKDGDNYIRTKCDETIAGYLRRGDGAIAKHFDGFDNFINENADGLVKAIYSGDDPALINQVKTNLVSGNGPEGGYFLPPAPTRMIETKIFESSPMRQVSSVVSTATDAFRFVLDDDEADCGWVGEVDTRSDTNTPTVGEIIIPVHEMYAQPKASQSNLDDAGFDVETWLGNKVSSRFGRKEATAFVSGDGAKQPKGFLDYTASSDNDAYERGTVGQLETAGSGVIVGDDLKGLLGLVKEDYQNNSIFGMKRSTWTSITKLKDTQNRYLFDIISNLRDGDIMKLLGQPVRLMNDMPAIATDALSVAYGDFREFYTIVDRMGIRVLRDPYTNKPFVKFYSTKRVGGAVTNYEAVKLLKIK